jgi:hypothetical protein
MTDAELIAQLRRSKGWPTLDHSAADRIEALAALHQAAAQDSLAAEAYADELEAKLEGAVKVLRLLIDHTHNCEKELTEELHSVEFCGESLPLTIARTTLAELKGETECDKKSLT